MGYAFLYFVGFLYGMSETMWRRVAATISVGKQNKTSNQRVALKWFEHVCINYRLTIRYCYAVILPTIYPIKRFVIV